MPRPEDILSRVADHTKENHTRISVMANDIEYIKSSVGNIKTQLLYLRSEFSNELKNGYVTQKEFEPVKKGVSGIIKTFVGTFIIAIISFFAWK